MDGNRIGTNLFIAFERKKQCLQMKLYAFHNGMCAALIWSLQKEHNPAAFIVEA